jgi:hypothetical protein
LRREGQDQVIARNIDIVSDPSKRESVRGRAKDRANELILERVGEEKENENENKGGTRKHSMPAARVEGQSRFKERFSLDTQRGSVSKYSGM